MEPPLPYVTDCSPLLGVAILGMGGLLATGGVYVILSSDWTNRDVVVAGDRSAQSALTSSGSSSSVKTVSPLPESKAEDT